jgi:hypothetical protein
MEDTGKQNKTQNRRKRATAATYRQTDANSGDGVICGTLSPTEMKYAAIVLNKG